MKQLLFFLTLALIISSCSSEGYILKGSIEGADNATVYLQSIEDNELVNIDSTQIKSGKFVFKGSVSVPDLFGVQIGNDSEDMIMLFLENSNITITGTLESLHLSEIKGSKTHDIVIEFNELFEARSEMLQDITNRYQTLAMTGQLTNELEAELIREYNIVSGEIQEFVSTFVLANSHSVASAYITMSYLADAISVEALEEIVRHFPQEIHTSTFVAQAIDKLELERRTAVGQSYTDFTLPNPNGEMLSLSSFVGNGYLLIDFWAAWCTPCRRKNPSLVKIYNNYSTKGFEVIGVSLDRSMDEWTAAIKNDGLSWPQVSDLMGWESPTARVYGIMGIPANLLLDKDGTILAKNLNMDQLDEMLESLIQ